MNVQEEGVVSKATYSATLGRKELLTLKCRLAAVIAAAMVSLLGSAGAFAQGSGDANKVLTGAAAFGDWHQDAPGVRRLFTIKDLPPIGTNTDNYAEVVAMPAGARPKAPEGLPSRWSIQALRKLE